MRMKSIDMLVVRMTIDNDSCQNVLFIGNNHIVIGSLLLDPVRWVQNIALIGDLFETWAFRKVVVWKALTF